MWDTIRHAFGTLANWIISVVRACWTTFLVFLHGVIGMISAVIKAVRYMIDKLIKKIDDWRDKIKEKIIRFFVIKTPKKDFTEIINQAKNENKIGTITMDLSEDTTNATTADSDVHIVQTDGDFNTQNVYTLRGDKFSEEFRRKCSQEVTEIELNL